MGKVKTVGGGGSKRLMMSKKKRMVEKTTYKSPMEKAPFSLLRARRPSKMTRSLLFMLLLLLCWCENGVD